MIGGRREVFRYFGKRSKSILNNLLQEFNFLETGYNKKANKPINNKNQ